MTTLAGGGSAGGVASGSVDGTGSAAMFFYPTGVAVSTSGTVYVVDRSNHIIRMISPTGTDRYDINMAVWHFHFVDFELHVCDVNVFNVLGVVTRLAGGGSAGGVACGFVDGTGSTAMFHNPASAAVSTSGTIYVADRSNHIIRMISPTGTKIIKKIQSSIN